MIEKTINNLATQLMKKKIKLATAESCTGGLIAKYCTDKVGSSSWFECAFITYSNESKIKMLGVQASAIEKHGAVSEQVALAMAQGAIKNSQAHAAIAVTGIAGPSGGSDTKPVGTVWIAISYLKNTQSKCFLFKGNRKEIRKQTAQQATEWLIRELKH